MVTVWCGPSEISKSSSRPAQAAPAGPTGEALDAAEFDLRFGRSPAVEGVERHLLWPRWEMPQRDENHFFARKSPANIYIFIYIYIQYIYIYNIIYLYIYIYIYDENHHNDIYIYIYIYIYQHEIRHHEPINNHYYFNEASGTVMISIIR